ncbi:MAG: hypothetical protein MJZ55_02220 [Paludibacteraceae bacterium]|nr:hypothetical protein [Paludibacteraceae bacterium]
MKSIWKHIIIATCALVVLVYWVAGVIMAHRLVPPPTCNDVTLRILDGAERQFVSGNELAGLLQRQHLYPMGQNMDMIVSQDIENAVRKHDMIRTCECHKTQNGRVIIAVTQRVPLIRVASVSGDTYLIDTDRKRMPLRAGMQTDALTVTGNIGERTAKHEAGDMTEWLKDDPYWNKYIARIEVDKNQQVRLIQRSGRANILLGDWSEYTTKLNKLRHWYQGSRGLDVDSLYQCMDVRFKKQVIGIKGI